MAKAYYKRFNEVVERLEQAGEMLVDKHGDKKIVIKKSLFDEITEEVKDFAELKEYTEELKTYRFGTHNFSFRKGKSVGYIDIEFEQEVPEEKENGFIQIFARNIKNNIDWFKSEDVKKDLEEIENEKEYYSNCDVFVNGNKILSF